MSIRPARRPTRLGALFAAVLGTAIAAPAAASDPPDLVVEGAGPSSGLTRRLEEEARRAYARAAEWFGEEIREPITVEWVTEESELGRTARENPGAVAGVAIPSDGRILLFAPALAPRPDRIPAVLLHEFCHLLFARATAGAEVEPPRWLDEGLATWLSGDWDLGLAYRSDQERILDDALAAGSLLSFRRLDAGFPEGTFFPLAYAQSRSFVEWLVARDGEGAMRRLLDELDGDLDPEPAFERVWGMTLTEAEELWRNDLGGSGPLRYLPSGRAVFAFASVAVAVLVLLRWFRVRRQLREADDEGPALDEPSGVPPPPGAPPDRSGLSRSSSSGPEGTMHRENAPRPPSGGSSS